MKSARLSGWWLMITGCIVVACGGADATDLFDTRGVSSGTSGASGTSGSAGTSGTSGTSGGTSGTSGGTSGTSGASGTSGGTSGTSGTSGGMGCRPSVPSDCGPDEYCQVTACAVIGGTCTPFPQRTDAFAPVCGCDNLTYYNETLAAAAAMNVSASRACAGASATACKSAGPATAPVPCPDGSFCDLEVTPQCQINLGASPGTCWALPDPCGANDAALYRVCNQAGGGSGGCKSLCTLVRGEKVFAKDAQNCK